MMLREQIKIHTGFNNLQRHCIGLLTSQHQQAIVSLIFTSTRIVVVTVLVILLFQEDVQLLDREAPATFLLHEDVHGLLEPGRVRAAAVFGDHDVGEGVQEQDFGGRTDLKTRA